MRKRRATISYFHCLQCKSVTPLARYGHRERGHIKDIWCYKCKDVTKHLEERYQDFVLKEDNFDTIQII